MQLGIKLQMLLSLLTLKLTRDFRIDADEAIQGFSSIGVEYVS